MTFNLAVLIFANLDPDFDLLFGSVAIIAKMFER